MTQDTIMASVKLASQCKVEAGTSLVSCMEPEGCCRVLSFRVAVEAVVQCVGELAAVGLECCLYPASRRAGNYCWSGTRLLVTVVCQETCTRLQRHCAEGCPGT